MRNTLLSRGPIAAFALSVLALGGAQLSVRRTLATTRADWKREGDSLAFEIRGRDIQLEHVKRALSSFTLAGVIVEGRDVVSGRHLRYAAGESLYVVLVSPFCSFSPRALPEVRARQSRGQRVVVVSLDGDSLRVAGFARRYKLSMPVLLSPSGSLVRAFGRGFTPVSVEVARGGTIATITLGVSGRATTAPADSSEDLKREG